MSVSAIRSSLYLSRFFPNKRTIFSNCLSKTSFSVSQTNARTITRSLFVLCRNRESDSLRQIRLSEKFSCSCGLHTKGDEELAAFLGDEIETERKAQIPYDVSKLDGFQCGYSGAEVTLTKKYNNEMITIKSNVNNSVDCQETVSDPNDPKEPLEPEMKAKPEFTIEIKKAKKTLSFHCTYNQSMPEEEADAEPYQASPLDLFPIQEEAKVDTKKTVWQSLEEKNLKLLVQFAPTNAFEEMIMWTEQGKHWKFPIDNETEMGAEENVGFHEHVFLDQHLHGFPTKGPIRHFMELVAVGLSKNPYITVERKIENIDWFRDYFKEKEDILRETGALG